jgi:peptide/nickel transport system permease protein
MTQSSTGRKIPLRVALGSVLPGLLLLAVVAAPWWVPYDPLAIDLRSMLARPSWAHFLGTDEFGRDVFSRAVEGGRVSVGIALATVACSITVGTLVGAIAGFLRGWTDRVIMVCTDALLAFPGLLLALGLISVLGSGESTLVLALATAYLPLVIRVVRGGVLSIREREYVEASRVMGNSEIYSMFRHVVPNGFPQIAVLATSMFGWVVLSESALSFLGVGIAAPAPTWGNMLASARPYLSTDAWLGVVPGVCIAGTLLGVNLLADALRDHFDPRRVG